MNLEQIRESLLVIMHDAAESEKFLNSKPDSQFARRTFIRSTFSTMEGAIWLLKTVCLKANPGKSSPRLTIAEYTLLREQTYELKPNGELKTSAKFLKLPDNIRFTFKMINKLFGDTIDVGAGTEAWDSFLEALAVRNRITHPKDFESLTVNEAEIALCKRVGGWSATLIAHALNAFFKNNEDGTTKDEPLIKLK